MLVNWSLNARMGRNIFKSTTHIRRDMNSQYNISTTGGKLHFMNNKKILDLLLGSVVKKNVDSKNSKAFNSFTTLDQQWERFFSKRNFDDKRKVWSFTFNSTTKKKQRIWFYNDHFIRPISKLYTFLHSYIQ